ncbi:MAG: methyltransferase [Pseudomonadota bacterium]
MKAIFFGAALCTLALSSAALAAGVPSYVAKAVADPSRPATDSSRDALRLPGETLAFVGVKPGMTVAEFFPSGGYYTRMISDVVGPKGKVYGIDNLKWDKGEDAKMAAEPGHSNVSIQLVKFGEFSLPQKVDVVWTTQNYHDLHVAEYGPVDVADFNKRVHDALKPGGIYFILDHQANPGTDDAGIAKVHRIEKSQVIKEVTAAGFKLVGDGNALHRTTDDHTKGSSDPAIKSHTDQFMLKFQRV